MATKGEWDRIIPPRLTMKEVLEAIKREADRPKEPILKVKRALFKDGSKNKYILNPITPKQVIS